MEDRLLQTFILLAAFFVVFFTYVLQQKETTTPRHCDVLVRNPSWCL
jgi:hypothetical protein